MSRRIRRICVLFMVCASLFAGHTLAAGSVRSLSPMYEEETVLFGEAVCPVLLPGEEDGSVRIRWPSQHSEPVTIHFAADDGSGTLPETHFTVDAVCERSRAWPSVRLFFYEATLELEPGTYLYGLAPAGEEQPEKLYPIRWRTEDGFRVVMSSDSHISNGKEVRFYEEAIVAGSGERGADLVIHGGDWNENAESEPFVLTYNAPHTRSIPTAVVCGNHDRSKTLYECITPPHMDKKTGDYWFIQNNILFVGLNIDYRDSHAHAAYVRETIPAHREGCDWVVCMLHYTMMANGAHDHDQPVANYRMDVAPVLSELDVDMVFSGHDHEYDRSWLIGADGAVEGSDTETLTKAPGETLYLCLPTAVGTKFYTHATVPFYPVAAEALKFERGYVVADFTPESVAFTVWNAETGAVEDSFTLTKAA